MTGLEGLYCPGPGPRLPSAMLPLVLDPNPAPSFLVEGFSPPLRVLYAPGPGTFIRLEGSLYREAKVNAGLFLAKSIE